MTDRISSDAARSEALSALVDGQATSSEVADACSRWAHDAGHRARWAEYQLIGDVMRSEELGAHARGDDFLARFRERLAAEPVVLAPGRVAAAAPAQDQRLEMAAPHALHRRRWAGPLSVAASFVAVVAALLNTGVDLGDGRVDLASRGQGVTLSLNAGQGGGAWPVAGASLERAPSFLRPDAGGAVTTVHVLRDPRAEEPVSARSVEGGPVTFSSTGGLARQAVYAAP